MQVIQEYSNVFDSLLKTTNHEATRPLKYHVHL